MKPGKPTSFLLLLGALLAAGCGTATSVPPAAASAGATPDTAGATTDTAGATTDTAGATTATVSAGTAGSRPPGAAGQRAAADARMILGKFVPPPGAVRLARKPALPGGSPAMSLDAATQAGATGYWRVSGAPTALLAWEKAHIWPGFARQDVIIGPPSWNTVYTLPAVPGEPTREMNVQFYDAGGGATVIMAAAMVSWTPPRAAAEVIPPSVTAVTIAPDGRTGPQPPVPVTITSGPVVRRLAALVNGLPLSNVAEGTLCPMATGLRLTFTASPGGPPAAVADGPGECSQVTFTLGGKDEPALAPPGSYLATVLKIAGLRWKLG